MHSFAPVPTVIPGWRGFLPTRVELLWGWSAHLPIAAATVSPAVVVALLRKNCQDIIHHSTCYWAVGTQIPDDY